MTDLDGDGGPPDILVLSGADSMASIYRFGGRADDGGSLALVRSAPFSGHLRVASRASPASVAVGRLEGESGAQVIAIVTHGLSVHCLDSRLQILWERVIPRDIRAGYYLRCEHLLERSCARSLRRRISARLP